MREDEIRTLCSKSTTLITIHSKVGEKHFLIYFIPVTERLIKSVGGVKCEIILELLCKDKKARCDTPRCPLLECCGTFSSLAQVQTASLGRFLQNRYEQ